MVVGGRADPYVNRLSYFMPKYPAENEAATPIRISAGRQPGASEEAAIGRRFWVDGKTVTDFTHL